jgi:Tfp pilus assembly protein PilF
MRIHLRVLVVGLFSLAGVGCLHSSTVPSGIAGGGWSDSLTSGGHSTPPPSQDLPPKSAAVANLTLAESLEKQGKDTDAIEYYERARQLDPGLNDRASRRLAVLYDRNDNQAQALIEFKDLLRKKPKDPTLLNDIGYSYYNRGDWAEAESHLRRAIVADKNYKPAWVNLGLTLAQQGRESEAIDAFLKAVSQAEAHANLGFVLASQGKKAEAIAAYRRALELEPTLRLAQVAVAKLEAGPAPLTPPDTSITPASGL